MGQDVIEVSDNPSEGSVPVKAVVQVGGYDDVAGNDGFQDFQEVFGPDLVSFRRCLGGIKGGFHLPWICSAERE